VRKALVVGIDHYANIGCLKGAVNDARSVAEVLECNADGTLNFSTPRLLVAADAGSAVARRQLKDAVLELFSDDSEIALLYFSGHGYIEDTGGGYLCASDCMSGDDGLSLAEVMTTAHKSKAHNKVIILDSCHSGAMGSNPIMPDLAEVSDGTTILTASTAEQYAMETGGSGVFTTLLVDALNGAAANLLGAVTPGSVYAHIDQSLGPWAQRPVFKTNVKRFVSLRTARAALDLAQLKQLPRLFPSATTQFRLDPSYEPERSGSEDVAVPFPDPRHTADFALLQTYRSVNLVRPVGAPHMWHAAMESKSCELTLLGQHYWRLAHERLL
jgi:uncharacterized caspase-like protein